MKPLGVIQKKQKGGVIPLAAVIPGLMAAGKTAGLAGLAALLWEQSWVKKPNSG